MTVSNVIHLSDERRKRGLPPPVLEAAALALAVTMFAVGLGLMGFFAAMMIAGSR